MMPDSAWARRMAGYLLALAGAVQPAFASPAAPPRAPQAIYAKTCGYCHGAHVAPIIRGRNLPPEIIMQYVRTGPRSMPAFRPTEISDVELQALAKWVSTSKADPKEHSDTSAKETGQ